MASHAPTSPPVRRRDAVGWNGGYVAALDGLRAVAVLAVIGYHLQWPFIGGGFLGVDLFFVLSGFLITSILLRLPSDRPLRSHLAHFYLRRTRRLLPALTLLLIAVSAWAAFIAIPEQLTNLRQQGLGTIFYVSNWVFMAEDVTYFEAFTDPSPLQHTWSLAIEEQFYLVWPLLLLVLLVRRVPRLWLVMATTVIALGSAILMWVTASSGALNDAYLGTFSRIHELLIGALAAMLISGLALSRSQGRHRAASPVVVTVTVLASSAVIAASMVLLTPEGTAYYEGGSVLFSVVVATLIVVLVRYRPDGGFILGNPVMRWIGAISYGLYLWHWPIIVWLTPATTPFNGLALDAVRLLVMFAASALSFYAIEQPIRRGGWPRVPISTRAWWIAVPVSMAVTAGLMIASTGAATAGAQEPESQAKVAAADHLLGTGNNDDRTLLITGDSVPKELMGALDDAAAQRDVSIIPLAFGGCSVVGLFQVEDDGSGFTWSRRCTDAPRLQDDALVEYSPDTVVWFSNRERYGVRVGDDEILAAGSPEHRARLEAEIEARARALTTTGAELVIVQPAAKAQETIGRCSRDPQGLGCSGDPAQVESFEWLRSVYARVADEIPGVRLVSVDDILCPTGAPCPTEYHDGRAIRPDGVHIARDLEPWFAEILLDRILA